MMFLVTSFLRLEENRMPRLFGYGPERGTFEHLAHKVKVFKQRILQATFYDIQTYFTTNHFSYFIL